LPLEVLPPQSRLLSSYFHTKSPKISTPEKISEKTSNDACIFHKIVVLYGEVEYNGILG